MKFRARSKYRAVRTSCGLHDHQSKKEARKCGELTLLAKGGAIHRLKYQPEYELFAYDVQRGEPVRIGKYIADFEYVDLDKPVVLDVKGMKTPVYRLKKKLMKACYGIEVQEA